MSFRSGTVKDFSGFDNKDITPKSVRTVRVTTDYLTVKKDAVITALTADTIDASQLTVNGQLTTTSTTTIDLNGDISINNQRYVLTISEFQDAIAQAAIEGGLSIHVAPGIFPMSSQIIVPPNTDIRGSGKNTTIFRALDGFSDTSLFLFNSSLESSLSDCTIDGNSSSAKLVQISSSNDITLDELQLMNTSTQHILVQNSSNNITIKNCIFRNTQAGLTSNSAIYIHTGSSFVFMNLLEFRDMTLSPIVDLTLFVLAGGSCISGSSADPLGVLTESSINNIFMDNITIDTITASSTSLIDMRVPGFDNGVRSVDQLVNIRLTNASITDCTSSYVIEYAIVQFCNINNIFITDSTITSAIRFINTQSGILSNIKLRDSTFSSGIIMLHISGLYPFGVCKNIDISSVEMVNTVPSAGTGFASEHVTGTSNLIPENIVLNNYIADNITTGIRIENPLFGSSFNNIQMANISTSGISIDTTTNSYPNTIQDIQFSNSNMVGSNGSSYGVQIDALTGPSSNVTNISFTDCNISGFRNGILYSNISDLSISGCSISSPTGETGVIGYDVGVSPTPTNKINKNNKITNCLIVTKGRSIQLNGEENLYISGINSRDARDTNFPVSTTPAISIGNSNDIIISDTFTSNVDSGIDISDSDTITISNNQLKGISGETINFGIRLSNTSNVSLTGNKFFDFGNAVQTISETHHEYQFSLNKIQNVLNGITVDNISGALLNTGIISQNILSNVSNRSIFVDDLANVSRNLKIIDNVVRVTKNVNSSLLLGTFENQIIGNIEGGSFTMSVPDINIGSSKEQTLVESLDSNGSGNVLTITPNTAGNDLTTFTTGYTSVLLSNAETAIFEWSGSVWDVKSTDGSVV